jgi:hypothetical protein
MGTMIGVEKKNDKIRLAVNTILTHNTDDCWSILAIHFKPMTLLVWLLLFLFFTIKLVCSSLLLHYNYYNLIIVYLK